MTVAGGITVRAAEPADATAIRDLAFGAWWATYRGRLTDETIERFLAQAYTEERIALRIGRHEVLVAGDAGAVDAFAEVVDRDDHIQLVAIYARPSLRGRGLGSALVASVTSAHPVEDIAAAVRFLAGPESGWITGEALAVDGGHHLRRGANYGLLFG